MSPFPKDPHLGEIIGMMHQLLLKLEFFFVRL